MSNLTVSVWNESVISCDIYIPLESISLVIVVASDSYESYADTTVPQRNNLQESE